MDLSAIGRNIRKYRTQKKLRQEELAEKTSLSTNYVGMVERGEKIPALETFLKFADALEVSADMLLVDVTYHGYTIKDSLLAEKLEKLSPADREKIYDVIDTMIKHSK
ncbi:MAG: helix-turn-helix transcriptional regulator [Clostridia bacterium]|nr:helix-turn-helix transcriptional regulator [Clostridia bacterium]